MQKTKGQQLAYYLPDWSLENMHLPLKQNNWDLDVTSCAEQAVEQVWENNSCNVPSAEKGAFLALNTFSFVIVNL